METAIYNKHEQWLAIYNGGLLSTVFFGRVAHEKISRFKGTVIITISKDYPATIDVN